MSIGLLALGFALICSPVALFGMLQPTEASKEQKADYSGIYKALVPRDL